MVWLSAVLGVLATLPAGVGAQGIYTCVDAKAHVITSDRPILECIDRVQKELTPSGTVKRTVKPSLTVDEQAKVDEELRKQAEERARQAEDKRRDRALLARYPNRAVHDKGRAEALTQVDAVAKAASLRLADLVSERSAMDTEIEFYKKDPDKMPLALKRRIEGNEQNQAAQKRFALDQEAEKKRVNAHYDEELDKLKLLWSQQAGTATTADTDPAKK